MTESGRKQEEIKIKAFGSNIRNVRLRKKLSQEQVGELSGMHAKYLSEIERGKKKPSAVAMCRISRALGVPICEVLTNDECPYLNNGILRELEGLFAGKDEQAKQKAIRILEVFFE